MAPSARAAVALLAAAACCVRAAGASDSNYDFKGANSCYDKNNRDVGATRKGPQGECT